MTKKLSWEVQGKTLVFTASDGRTSQSWTIRPTHTAGQKAESFRDIAEALDPALTIEPLPYYPPERSQEVPQQGPVPPPLFGASEPFVSRYEPSQGVPSVIPSDPAEARSLEELKERAYRLAQQNLGLVAEGHDSGTDIERLPEINAAGKAGGNPHVYGMPQLAKPDTQGVRERPKLGHPNYLYEDTH